MRPSDQINCPDFPCPDVRHDCFDVPTVDVDPERIRILLISEASPQEAKDRYYAGDSALFAQTTVQAFKDAGAKIELIQDIVELGVYLTPAVKCGKTAYAIQTRTIDACSRLLEREIALFPNIRVYLLMGDVAIRAINTIARRQGEPRVVPAGSTYKIRGGSFHYRGARALPSYLQAGPSFFIEKSKRKMIAEDIRTALAIL